MKPRTPLVHGARPAGRVPTRLLLLAAALGLWLHPGTAGAYVRTMTEQGAAMRWADPRVPVLVYLGSPPGTLTLDLVLGAVMAGARAWSQSNLACTGLSLIVEGTDEANGPAADDRRNRITFRRERWGREPCSIEKPEECITYDRRALAITSVLAVRRTGEIVDADMELNAVDNEWGDVVANPPTDATRKVHDLQNTVTHEFGHLIGLDHTCTDGATRGVPVDDRGNLVPPCSQASAELRATTMFNEAGPFDTGKRDLADDDSRAVCEIYPAGQGRVDLDRSETGGCSVPTMGQQTALPPALLLLALAGLLLVLRRSAR